MNHEQMIKEARTIEAMKKGYMGLEGKFSSIAKRLGKPIIKQGGLYSDTNYLQDFDELADENEIPIMEEEDQIFEIGLQFDGLSRGINMTISIQYHLREIVVRYEGNVVYKENGGELEGYVPHEFWENKIDELYEFVRKLERADKPFKKNILIQENLKKKKQVLEYLKNKWGLQ
jgi:hypothetical protein